MKISLAQKKYAVLRCIRLRENGFDALTDATTWTVQREYLKRFGALLNLESAELIIKAARGEPL